MRASESNRFLRRIHSELAPRRVISKKEGSKTSRPAPIAEPGGFHRTLFQTIPPGLLQAYFINVMRCVCTTPEASNRTRYTPVGNPPASNTTACLPAATTPSTSTTT